MIPRATDRRAVPSQGRRSDRAAILQIERYHAWYQERMDHYLPARSEHSEEAS